MRYDHILVATDFGEPAAAAITAGAVLAHKLGSRVHLLHVQRPIIVLDGPTPEMAELEVEVQQQHRRELEALRARELGDLLGDVRTVMHPSPTAAIVDAAREADLCVLGSHGRTGPARFFIGSVAERVVRHAPCDVLVARPPSWPPSHVVVATDFSEGSLEAIDAARTICGVLGARLTVAHVLDPDLPVPSDDARGFLELSDVRERLEKQLHELVRERLPGAGAAVELLTHAQAADRLASYGESNEVGLLVVGSHGRTGIVRFLLGSVAERTVRLAPCSVLVVRRRPPREAPLG